MGDYTVAEVAAIFNYKPNTIRVYSRRYGIGHLTKGKLLFSERDISIIQSHKGKVGKKGHIKKEENDG